MWLFYLIIVLAVIYVLWRLYGYCAAVEEVASEQEKIDNELLAADKEFNLEKTKKKLEHKKTELENFKNAGSKTEKQ